MNQCCCSHLRRGILPRQDNPFSGCGVSKKQEEEEELKMRLRTLFWSSCISAAIAVSAIPAAAATVNQCAAGKPTAASYTWDFKSEVNTIFKDVQTDAEQALYHSDELQKFAGDPSLDWQLCAEQLDYLRSEINDIGTRLCRLETIRRVAAPWQQHVIDQIATDARLMADNAQDAIVFGNTKPKDLWLATYQKSLNNLYSEASSLMHSVGKAVEFANVSNEYQELR